MMSAMSLQISSRKVMQQVLLQNGVPAEAFSPVCVIVDKLDKIGAEKARIRRLRRAQIAPIRLHVAVNLLPCRAMAHPHKPNAKSRLSR